MLDKLLFYSYSNNYCLTWPELPKQLSTIAMRRALASLLTVGNGRIKAGHLELDIQIGSEEEKRRRFMAPHDNIISLSLHVVQIWTVQKYIHALHFHRELQVRRANKGEFVVHSTHQHNSTLGYLECTGISGNKPTSAMATIRADHRGLYLSISMP